MTDMTITKSPHLRILRHLRLRLPDLRRPPRPEPVNALSDHTLRDIGIQRVELDHLPFAALRPALLWKR